MKHSLLLLRNQIMTVLYIHCPDIISLLGDTDKVGAKSMIMGFENQQRYLSD